MKVFRRRFRPGPLTTRRRVALIAAVALPVALIFTFSSRGLMRRVQLEMEADGLRQEVYRQRAVGDSLRREIHTMQEDTAAMERLARERYGMARKGETIYRVRE